MNLNQSETPIQTRMKLINTYWTRPRPIFKIIMLARSIVGDAEGGAHYRSRKHDNFDIGRGRVQISVLVSDKPMCVFEKVFC